MNFKVGDQVVVIAGSNKGKTGKIIKTFFVVFFVVVVVVEGVNMVKKHVRETANSTGGILEVEAPIHASNVMIVDPKTKKRTRIGHTTNKNNKKIRITKKSNVELD